MHGTRRADTRCTDDSGITFLDPLCPPLYTIANLRDPIFLHVFTLYWKYPFPKRVAQYFALSNTLLS